MCLPRTALFHHRTPVIFCISFPNTITSCTPSKHSAYFPTCPLTSPKETMILPELPKSHSLAISSYKLSSSLVFRFVVHTHILFVSLLYLKLEQLPLLCRFFFQLPQRFPYFLLHQDSKPSQFRIIS